MTSYADTWCQGMLCYLKWRNTMLCDSIGCHASSLREYHTSVMLFGLRAFASYRSKTTLRKLILKWPKTSAFRHTLINFFENKKNMPVKHSMPRVVYYSVQVLWWSVTFRRSLFVTFPWRFGYLYVKILQWRNALQTEKVPRIRLASHRNNHLFVIKTARTN